MCLSVDDTTQFCTKLIVFLKLLEDVTFCSICFVYYREFTHDELDIFNENYSLLFCRTIFIFNPQPINQYFIRYESKVQVHLSCSYVN